MKIKDKMEKIVPNQKRKFLASLKYHNILRANPEAAIESYQSQEGEVSHHSPQSYHPRELSE